MGKKLPTSTDWLAGFVNHQQFHSMMAGVYHKNLILGTRCYLYLPGRFGFIPVEWVGHASLQRSTTTNPGSFDGTVLGSKMFKVHLHISKWLEMGEHWGF